MSNANKERAMRVLMIGVVVIVILSLLLTSN